MNYKEKAEAYVREKLPELMELSPGCVVGHESSKDNRYVIDFSFQPEGEVKQWALHSELEQDQATITDKYMKNHMDYLYGHPIQLQHWLKILDMLEESRKPTHHWAVNSFGECDSTDDLLKGEFMFKFNLTTGQPATEVDYQALCNIFGI